MPSRSTPRYGSLFVESGFTNKCCSVHGTSARPGRVMKWHVRLQAFLMCKVSRRSDGHGRNS